MGSAVSLESSFLLLLHCNLLREMFYLFPSSIPQSAPSYTHLTEGGDEEKYLSTIGSKEEEEEEEMVERLWSAQDTHSGDRQGASRLRSPCHKAHIKIPALFI